VTIGIVFVNYFSTDLIAETVDDYSGADVMSVVVDNSGDYRGPGTVVGDGTNIGFGSACNLGVAELDPSIRTVVLHNPDVYTSVDVVQEAAHRVHRDGIGIVAPALETPDGLVLDGYNYPRLTAEILATRRNTRSPGDVDHQTAQPGSSRRALRAATRAVERSARFGSAALLAVDVAAFHDIGGFDDRFILYGEDLDLWHRMKLSGRQVVFANDLSAFHERGRGSPASRQTRELLRFAGIQLFAQLHYGSRWRLFRAIHQRGLSSVDPANEIGALLRHEWSSDHDPTATSRALRASFNEGVMAAPGSDDGAPLPPVQPTSRHA
jgi:GT2 family glycosyltransferase